MHWLELKDPPPLVGLLIGAAMWFAAPFSGQVQLDFGIRVFAAVVLAVLGLAIALSGSAAFRKAQTTMNPLKPETASSLVVGGVYRYTRNPMYLGMAAILVGWSVYLTAPLTLAGPVFLVWFLTRFQIIPEERVLSEKFSQHFAEYRQRVRRWL